AITLVLSRNLRNHAPLVYCRVGRTDEGTALTGLELWLRRLGPQPELLRRALEELTQHEAQVPPPTDSLKAHYLGLRERLAAPSSWLWNILPASSPLGHLEADLVALAAQVPWEKARQTR